MATKKAPAGHKKDADATEDKRKAYLALLKKHGVDAQTGTRHLTGSRRSECKVALNWLHHNPAPKTRKKKEG